MHHRPLLAAALAAFAGGSLAQSTLTVFGVADVAVRGVDNDDRQVQLASGGNQTGRLGFRGSEDLGGGWSAGYWLEGALTLDDGNADGFDFRRRSTIGLVSTGLGELRLGRDRVPTYLDWSDYDPFADSGIGASSRLSIASGIVPSGGAYDTFKRADNLIGYFLPPGLGGLFGQVAYAPDESQPGQGYFGGRIGYRAGPLTVSGSYGRTEVTAADDTDLWNIGASYDFGLLELMGLYSSLEIGDGSQGNWLVGATAPVGGFELRVSYQSMHGDGTLDDQSASMVAVGAVYALSRRTVLYGTLSYIDNDGTGFTVASGSSLTTGNRSKGFEAGIRHSF